MSSKRLIMTLLGTLALSLLLSTQAAYADNVYATVRGTVTDSTGAILSGVRVTATNTQTGVASTTTSADTGQYEFVQLPVGTYTVSATRQGFKTFKSTQFTLTVNQVYGLAISLPVGEVSEIVEVKANAVQVETTSIQQQTLINSQQIVDLPLNGRNFTQLQQLAPGVMSGSDRFGVGPQGTNFSVNGAQTQQSSFLINGLDTNDIPLNTAQILPSPDAIQEFNLISSTINPEYGRNSGGIVNALIKNGTNQFHGSGFEFFRDNALNARSFFSPVNATPVFHQNQFGGTFGGPIWKDKTFFFLSYQGTYNRSSGTTGAPQSTTVFSQDQRNGIFPDISGGGGTCPLNNGPGPCSPRALVDENGVLQPAGTPYSALFPTGHIPAADLNPLAVKLMNQFVPLPNAPNGAFNFSPIDTLKANQGIMRIDHNITQNNTLWGVYLVEDAPATAALPFTGATLPGFTEVDKGRTNDITISWTHTFNTTTLNEARIGYARFNFDAVEPQTPALPSSFGFSGINPQNTASASMPLVNVAGFFTLGFSTNGPQPRKDQNYQFTDNFSKIMGNHALKMGFDVRRFQVDNPFFGSNNGAFQFGGGGPFSTLDPGADFLLGIPDTFSQGAGGVINARAYEYYGYFQDQWKIKSNLTLTLGSGYQVDTPYNNNQFGGEGFNCFIPTQQSKIFPTAPLGLNYPGDPGCTKSGTQTRYGHLAPRFGFAWSPKLGPISGSNNKFSIRGGFGLYYNRTEEEGALQNLGAPPFGVTSNGAVSNGGAQASFANPFQDQVSGTTFASIFPFTNFPKPGQAFDFTTIAPLGINVIDPKLSTPYSMNFNLNIEREFPGNTVLSLGYVGSQARHLYRAYEGNLETLAGQAACKNNPTCVALASQQSVFFPANLTDSASFPVPGTPNGVLSFIPTAGTQHTDGNSNYNAFQANVTKGMSHGLQLIASFTWSHAIDNGSSFEDSGFGFRGINPFVPALNIGDSSNDARRRLVLGYTYLIPSLHHMANWAPDRIFGGWKLTGIVTFQDGFPINISTNQASSLFCSVTFYACPDNPNQVAPVTLLDPKAPTINGKTGFYFNPADFAQVPTCKFDGSGNLLNGNVCGQFGNVGRNSIHAPGINNFDMGFAKDTKLTERTSLELGVEAFNVFNHTNFEFAGQDATSHGDISSGNFGRITASAPGRLLQLRAKVTF